MNLERFEQRPVAERGTAECEWQRAGTVFPTLDYTSCARLVVVAPHPDDEVLGVGGWASLMAASGVDVTVVAVTDGGASHRPTPARSRHRLEALRDAESRLAMVDLGIDDRIRMGLPDGRIAAHEDELADRLLDVLGRSPSTWCAATSRTDGHPDHEATGRAAAAAARAAGCTLVEYPVWMWHWARPADPEIDWESARSVALDGATRERKELAVSRFRTQLTNEDGDAILPPWVVERLTRSHETVFV